ncbi:MAG: hypothetical protein ABW185_24610, partial [Sedimenticola sp.]
SWSDDLLFHLGEGSSSEGADTMDEVFDVDTNDMIQRRKDPRRPDRRTGKIDNEMQPTGYGKDLEAKRIELDIMNERLEEWERRIAQREQGRKSYIHERQPEDRANERRQAVYEKEIQAKMTELDRRRKRLEKWERQLEVREREKLERQRVEQVRASERESEMRHTSYEKEVHARLRELDIKTQMLEDWERELTRREHNIEYTQLRQSYNVKGTEDKQYTYPKFSSFSGEEPRPRTEVSYDEWKYELNCVREDKRYPEYTIAEAVRRSLRGQAKRVLIPLGPSSTVPKMLDKLESIFGNVSSGESLLQEFYMASQKADETVSAWGLRLEEILQKAIDKKYIDEEKKNDMLRNRFWKALRSEKLKAATRVRYETTSSFELLRRAVREEEHELKLLSSGGAKHYSMTTQEEDSKFDMLMKKITSLEKQVQLLNQVPKKRWTKNPQQSDQQKNKDSLN